MELITQETKDSLAIRVSSPRGQDKTPLRLLMETFNVGDIAKLTKGIDYQDFQKLQSVKYTMRHSMNRVLTVEELQSKEGAIVTRVT